MRKRIIYVLIMSLIIILLLIGIKHFLNKKNNTEENIIDLNKYTNDVTINEGGEYTITGEFKYSIVVSTNDKVVLNLNNVMIDSTDYSSIANLGTNELVINLIDGTTNVLTSDGKSEYNGCIYSNGDLTINGYGSLEINSKLKSGEGISVQNNDITINGGNISIKSNDDGINAGGDNGGLITINGGNIYVKSSGDGIDSNDSMVINGGVVYSMGDAKGGDAALDTDNGFEINGGLVLGLGYDMLELPQKTSKQYSINYDLKDIVSKNTLITLLNENDEVIVSFIAKEKFKTLIISSDKITKGTYYLYLDGENTGELKNYIYQNGKYTKGTLLLTTKVNDIVTEVK